MKIKSFSLSRLLVVSALVSCVVAFGQAPPKPIPQFVHERDVLAHEEFLASDAMQGRGSMTQYELLAGMYVGAQLRQFGIEPAGDADASGQRTYIQTVEIPARLNGASASGAQRASGTQNTNAAQPAPSPQPARHTYNAVGVLR